MTLRTLEGLQQAFDKEFSWRMQELSQLRLAIKAASGTEQKTLIRSGVTMLYAHWEGFIKKAAEDYLKYIDKKAMKYDALSTSFVALGMRKLLHQLSDTKKHRLRVDIVDFLLNHLNDTASVSGKSVIDTQANLNSEVLDNILCVVGISLIPYEAKYPLIDESLLARRNSIAHGEFLDVDQKEYLKLNDDIVALMRGFKADLENAATLGTFKK